MLGEGFQCVENASVMVEDGGAPHTINVCTNCYNVKQNRRKEPMTSNKQWKLVVAEKRSRDKLSAGFGYTKFRNMIWECFAAKRTLAKSLLERRGDGTEIGQTLDRGVAGQGRPHLCCGSARVYIWQAWCEERSGREERTIGQSC